MLRLSNEEGQTMAEYGLIVALVAVVVIVGVMAFGASLQSFWNALAGAIPGSIPG